MDRSVSEVGSGSSELDRFIAIAKKGAANVLITGPSGSGKTDLAYAIHRQSGRANGPFITVNLATVSEGVLESELFGHERGAFTGADQKRIGRLESAQGGTVFLDEIGELPLRLQARLLEVLQSRIVVPVGGNKGIRLDVKIIAATNRDLPRAIARGEFREDLFHRLRVVSLEMKPLRDRWDEFDQIVHRCLEEISQTAGRSVQRISEAVAQLLEQHDWPGNFRELRNVLEYAVLAGEGVEIGVGELPEWFTQALNKGSSGALGVAQECVTERDFVISQMLDYRVALADFEKRYLHWHLSRCQGRLSQTARKIRLNKSTLLRRLRLHGLSPSQAVNPHVNA